MGAEESSMRRLYVHLTRLTPFPPNTTKNQRNLMIY